MAIQLRRGNYSNFDPQKMKPAEVAVVQSGDPVSSDGKGIYVAIQAGVVKRLASIDEMQDAIYNQTEEVIDQIEQGLADDIEQAEAAADRAEAAANSIDLCEIITTTEKKYSNFIDTSRWTFTQDLIPETGQVRPSSGKGCLVAYVGFPYHMCITLNNADYTFVVWTYSAWSQSSAVYSPNPEYDNREVFVEKKDGAVLFRIAFRRVDGATLTTDFSDSQSDAYKILNALKIFEANNRYVTPECFGAVGDGITDDTWAFTQAFTDGRPVFLDRKKYKTNIAITQSNVRVFGCGVESVLVPADTSKPVIKINVDTAESTSDIISNIVLQDFKIYGNSSSVIGISIRCAQFCILERLYIERCYTEGIRLRGVFDSKITDCDLMICGNTGFTGEDDGLGNYAVTIDKTTGMNTNAVVFKGLHVEHTPRMIKFQNTQQLMFVGCKFETHCKSYASYNAPISGTGIVKGVIFTNSVFVYSALLSDTQEPILFDSGNPLVVMDLNDSTDADETYVLFSACQFRTQNNRASVYFDVNHTNFIGCTFNRCDGSTDGNQLGKYSSLTDCNMMMINGVRALQLAGTQVLVDKTRINIGTEDASTSIINVGSTAARGKAVILYNGNDRSNLADGTIGIPVEFLGLRNYTPA